MRVSGAYRDSGESSARRNSVVPPDDIARRRRVARGALALTASLLVATQWAVPHGSGNWLAASAWFVAAGSAWVVTTPRPGRGRSWLEWVLLACMVGVGLLAVLAVVGLVGAGPVEVLVFIGLVAGLELVVHMFAAAGYARRAWVGRALMVAAAAGLALSLSISSRGNDDAARILVLALTAVALLLALLFMLAAEVVGDSWWLDNGASIPDEWVWLLYLHDGHVEVIPAEGQLGRFQKPNAAYDWLEQNGYVSEVEAVDRGLVAASPPLRVSGTGRKGVVGLAPDEGSTGTADARSREESRELSDHERILLLDALILVFAVGAILTGRSADFVPPMFAATTSVELVFGDDRIAVLRGVRTLVKLGVVVSYLALCLVLGDYGSIRYMGVVVLVMLGLATGGSVLALLAIRVIQRDRKR